MKLKSANRTFFFARSCALLMTVCLLGSSCLKTRAQLKNRSGEDDEEARRPTPAQVTAVEPSGGYVVEEMKSEITRLNGRIEDLERAQKGSAGVGPAQKEDLKKLENRMAELEQGQADLIETVKKLEERGAAASDPSEFLKKGKSLFQEQDFEGAVEAFSTYLKSPKAKKTEEATFFRGESYFRLKQYKKAIVDFSKFPEKFSDSSQMPAALLRIGQSFEALGMKEDAQGFYQELAEKFPKSAEAKKIKKPSSGSGKKRK